MIDEFDQVDYDEGDDNTAYYILCAWDHAAGAGPIPRKRVEQWNAELERLHGPIRRHETARPLYFCTGLSELAIGRLIDVPPMWLGEAFEAWRVTARCGHPVEVATRRAVKNPPAWCPPCCGAVQQQLFRPPPQRIGWVQYYERFRRADWKMLRRRKLNDQPFCGTCRATEHLDVHHNTYIRFGRERLEDLVVLCRDCHTKIHGPEHRAPRREGGGAS